ncbi:hypothetical protein Hsero_2370 [Herbaspirillum seropedicae SmR1]|uniref:Uncharacterized protein n=1 Tax=Herbaspirillum seropedicae (strain SmR1) TaxID=757424 RepID=D8IVD0_HERSS|nr:hypothetical protein [Herbaspirillum seropedicae]ADJ63869.1 hypothetical protein Hsero_2370 [Herbaspirillum seropedicae SmR1]
MSKAGAGSGGGNDLMLVAVLVVGAMMWTRMRGAVAGNTPRTVYVPASAPASNGSGVAQVATGIVGALGNWFSSPGTNGLPDTYNGTDTTKNSFGLYGPIGGTAEDPWYG